MTSRTTARRRSGMLHERPRPGSRPSARSRRRARRSSPASSSCSGRVLLRRDGACPGVEYAGDPVADFHRRAAPRASPARSTPTPWATAPPTSSWRCSPASTPAFSASDDNIYRLGRRPKLLDLSPAGAAALLRTRATTRPTSTPSTTASTSARGSTPPLGFHDMFFSGDFAAIDPEAAAAAGLLGLHVRASSPGSSTPTTTSPTSRP